MSDLKTYVVALATENPRRAEIAGKLDTLGIAFDFYDAVDGRTGLSSDWESQIDRPAATRAMHRPMSDAEFACALSHREIYRAFLASDANFALILEDDALVDSTLAGFIQHGGYRAAPILLLHHLNARVMGPERALAGSQSKAARLAMSAFRTAAYTLDRHTAERLLNALSPVQHTADWPIDLFDLGAYAATPEIVGHPPLVSGSSAIEASRSKANRPVSELLSLSYLRRKWRKGRSRKVS